MFNKIKNNKGFSLMEAMVVIIIIGICVAIWGVHGRDQIKISMMSEARSFCDRVVAQEKIHYANNREYVLSKGESGTASGDPVAVTKLNPLFIDAKENKYFNKFTIKAPKKGVLTITMHPDTNRYSDMKNYSVVATYTFEKDVITYEEIYG